MRRFIGNRFHGLRRKRKHLQRSSSCSHTLKLLLTLNPKPDWNREFHVFMDASDIAIGSVLMQKYDKN
jgi:hypothetical protein